LRDIFEKTKFYTILITLNTMTQFFDISINQLVTLLNIETVYE